uniref:SET domain-containing protein n=1 Tax=Moniliophthora roreri TaxID=221103 RepID=A0A0W0G5G7_MONRR
MAGDITVCNQLFASLGVDEKALEKTILWWLSAYPMVFLLKDRAVSLKQRKGSGEDGTRGFCVIATRNLTQNKFLFKLMGSTQEGKINIPHTQLSEIASQPRDEFFDGEGPYILAGPIRYVNHDCQQWDAEFV